MIRSASVRSVLSRPSHRLGRGDPGILPVLFVFLFISSMNTPRNLIAVAWFRFLASHQPGLVPDRMRPEPDHRRLGRAGARRSASASPFCSGSWRSRSQRLRAQTATGATPPPHMRLWGVVSGVAWRTLNNVFTNPALLFPSIMFPLFFFTAFAGGLSQVSELPGFDFPPGYTAFQFLLCADPVCCVRWRLHRLRDRARLRVWLRPPAAARGAQPEWDRSRLRTGGARSLDG